MSFFKSPVTVRINPLFAHEFLCPNLRGPTLTHVKKRMNKGEIERRRRARGVRAYPSSHLTGLFLYICDNSATKPGYPQPKVALRGIGRADQRASAADCRRGYLPSLAMPWVSLDTFRRAALR